MDGIVNSGCFHLLYVGQSLEIMRLFAIVETNVHLAHESDGLEAPVCHCIISKRLLVQIHTGIVQLELTLPNLLNRHHHSRITYLCTYPRPIPVQGARANMIMQATSSQSRIPILGPGVQCPRSLQVRCNALTRRYIYNILACTACPSVRVASPGESRCESRLGSRLATR